MPLFSLRDGGWGLGEIPDLAPSRAGRSRPASPCCSCSRWRRRAAARPARTRRPPPSPSTPSTWAWTPARTFAWRGGRARCPRRTARELDELAAAPARALAAGCARSRSAPPSAPSRASCATSGTGSARARALPAYARARRLARRLTLFAVLHDRFGEQLARLAGRAARPRGPAALTRARARAPRRASSTALAAVAARRAVAEARAEAGGGRRR